MKNIVLFESTGRSEALICAEKSAALLHEYGAECWACSDLVDRMKPEIQPLVNICDQNKFEKYADALISFGGDGTMLAAARIMINTDIPIMGVNVGKLGFLAEYAVEQLESSLKDLLNGEFRIVDRSVIETVYNDEKLFALNDFVLMKKDSMRVITVNAYANQNFIGSIRADGVILTTPTGSTAYSLSCGGPILAPSAEVLCLNPISPHALTLRPLVIPNSNEIRLELDPDDHHQAYLVADGQHKRVINAGDNIIIKKSEAIIKLIKPLNSSYYDLLRNKLLWATSSVDSANSHSKLDNFVQENK